MRDDSNMKANVSSEILVGVSQPLEIVDYHKINNKLVTIKQDPGRTLNNPSTTSIESDHEQSATQANHENKNL